MIIFTGCSLLILNRSDDNAPRPIDRKISDSTQYSAPVDEIFSNDQEKPDSLVTDFIEAILEPTASKKLDSAAVLIETATNHRLVGELAVAKYYLVSASAILSGIDNESITEDQTGYYSDLMDQISHFYDGYMVQADLLPAEIPLEAVISGVSEFDSDSTADEPIRDSDLEFDSTGLDSALKITSFPPVPLVMNERVQNAIQFFQGRGRKTFERWLQRAGIYVPIIAPILRQEGLPEDLVYLAMIESGFRPSAYSYANASGPWQFIRWTGRIFGLQSDWWYDERRDPIKSTIAATKYLKKLYVDFDDWYLALASYNCGEGKVARHIRRYGTRDFWQLRRLPRQTRNYVPTYIAATLIAKNPAAYGFEKIVYQTTPPVDSLVVTECVDLQVIAGFVGVREDSIRNLNPMIVRWCTPPSRDSTTIYLPHQTADSVAVKLANLPPQKKRKWIAHRVRSGETLSTIAHRYGSSIRAIRSFKQNRIRNIHRIRIGQLIYIPIPPGRKRSPRSTAVATSQQPNRQVAQSTTTDDETRYTIYRIKAGDTLWDISMRNNVSIRELKRINHIRNHRRIRPGDRIKIPVR